MKGENMKRFNKIISILLIAVMVFCLAACGAGGNNANNTNNANTAKDPTADYPGYYDISKMTEDGKDLTNTAINGVEVDPLAMMKAFGLRAFLVLEEGGKGFMHLFGEETELTWTQSEIKFTEESEVTIPFTYKDGVITLAQEGATMEFTKSTEAAPKRGETAAPDYSGIINGGDNNDAPELEHKEDINLANTVLVDNDKVAITATGINLDSTWGYEVNLLLENKTDKKLRYSLETATINGVVCDPMFSEEVAAGKKSNASASFNIDNLLTEGVGDPSRIDLYFRVYDADDWSADDLLKETYTIYPMGESKASVYTREDKAEDKVLAENDNFKVVVTGFDPDAFWGYTMKLYLENKTDKKLVFSMDDVSVNGFMIDPYYGDTIPGNSKSFGRPSWDNEELKKNNIETVSKIEFKLRVYYSDDWAADDLLNEVFTVEP